MESTWTVRSYLESQRVKGLKWSEKNLRDDIGTFLGRGEAVNRAALSAVLFLSIPDFVCFQRRPTPIGDSLGSYASGPKICHAGLGFNQPVFSHQILQSSDAEVNISSYLTFLPELPTYLTFLPDLPS